MLTGMEWLLILAIIAIILIWGPSKLPELARSIGLAKREFEKAAKGVEVETTKRPSKEEEELDEKLLEVAKSLGIETKGKTRAEILEEISKKVKEKEG